MEHLAWYELLLLFFAASFLGWVLETAAADIKQKKFVNRGLVTGPFCVMYGITTVLLTVGLGELRGIWLFLFSAIYATVVEWIGGHLIERLFHQRWWDYSGKKGNLDVKNSSLNIQEITIRTKFLNQSALGRFFKRHTNMSPSEYRESTY